MVNLRGRFTSMGCLHLSKVQCIFNTIKKIMCSLLCTNNVNFELNDSIIFHNSVVSLTLPLPTRFWPAMSITSYQKEINTQCIKMCALIITINVIPIKKKNPKKVDAKLTNLLSIKNYTYSMKQNPPGVNLCLSNPMIMVFIFPASENSLWISSSVESKFKCPTYTVYKFETLFEITFLDSKRSDDFTMLSVTCRNNSSISNFRDDFRSQSEYAWCIIECLNCEKYITKNKKYFTIKLLHWLFACLYKVATSKYQV
ncbi:hypothetical protein AGLY_009228 [Aphis glycines]|uniref:Uncharacterized protein n=1 Tax=Aphis glycines TaxID=307491 RepID=A0A6G0TKY9_APHGL|nr:hypothetical protein AGLY_009228 [Aphis glycines]